MRETARSLSMHSCTSSRWELEVQYISWGGPFKPLTAGSTNGKPSAVGACSSFLLRRLKPPFMTKSTRVDSSAG